MTKCGRIPAASIGLSTVCAAMITTRSRTPGSPSTARLRLRLGPAATVTAGNPRQQPESVAIPAHDAYRSAFISMLRSVTPACTSVVTTCVRVERTTSPSVLPNLWAASPRRAALGACSTILVPIASSPSRPASDRVRPAASSGSVAITHRPAPSHALWSTRSKTARNKPRSGSKHTTADLDPTRS